MLKFYFILTFIGGVLLYGGMLNRAGPHGRNRARPVMRMMRLRQGEIPCESCLSKMNANMWRCRGKQSQCYTLFPCVRRVASQVFCSSCTCDYICSIQFGSRTCCNQCQNWNGWEEIKSNKSNIKTPEGWWIIIEKHIQWRMLLIFIVVMIDLSPCLRRRMMNVIHVSMSVMLIMRSRGCSNVVRSRPHPVQCLPPETQSRESRTRHILGIHPPLTTTYIKSEIYGWYAEFILTRWSCNTTWIQ